MALPSTQHNVEIELSNVDRGVYETLALRVSRHPSESAEYLVARLLAYALEATEGLAFSTQGLGNADDPALWVRDLTGALTTWIEVGTPQPERLHKAVKACDRVVVYCHKDVNGWLRQNAGFRLHDPSKLEIIELERGMIARLVGTLDRRMRWVVSVSGGELYVEAGKESVSSALRQHPWPV